MQLSGSICIKLLKSGRAIFARKFTKSTLSDPHKVHTYFRLHTWINAFRFAFISLWNGGSRLSIITFTFAPHFIAPELFPYAIGFAIMQPCLYLNTRVRNPPTHMWEKKGSRKCETAGSFFRCSCQISTIAPRNCDKTSRQAALRQLLWQSNASYTFPPVNILDHINRHLKLDEKNCALKYIYGMITPPPAPKWADSFRTVSCHQNSFDWHRAMLIWTRSKKKNTGAFLCLNLALRFLQLV